MLPAIPNGGHLMELGQLRRRGFITLLGGAAVAWPIAARAQQAAMPVIGFLNGTSPDLNADYLRAFREGLKETGFVEGENVAIVYRWADGQIDRLPGLAAELARRSVAVLIASGDAASLASKAATTTIPIVFHVGRDPAMLGLVASLARPGGNLTGVNFFTGELAAKRLELLRELVPVAARVAALLNPANPNRETVGSGVELAASAMGLKVQVYEASTIGEIDAAFAAIARERPDALFVTGDPVFRFRRVQLALLAAHHRVPAIYALRDYAEAGGLISYGASLSEAHRQGGVYVGRILKGAKPADLPVVQSSKFELVINLQPARMLGLTVPPSLLATADEVID
jgi:putative ABC transport system substrate-binding protein